jgi:hypothetical protein
MIELVEDFTPDPNLREFRDRVSGHIAKQVEQAINRGTFVRSLTSLAVDARAEGIRDCINLTAKMLEIEGVACWGGGFTDRFNDGYRQALKDSQTHMIQEYVDKDGTRG